MTENALLEALRTACTPKDEGRGVRVEEIQKATGWSPGRIRRALAEGITAGTVGRDTRYIIRLDGKRSPVPGYYRIGKK